MYLCLKEIKKNGSEYKVSSVLLSICNTYLFNKGSDIELIPWQRLSDLKKITAKATYELHDVASFIEILNILELPHPIGYPTVKLKMTEGYEFYVPGTITVTYSIEKDEYSITFCNITQYKLGGYRINNKALNEILEEKEFFKLPHVEIEHENKNVFINNAYMINPVSRKLVSYAFPLGGNKTSAFLINGHHSYIYTKYKLAAESYLFGIKGLEYKSEINSAIIRVFLTDEEYENLEIFLEKIKPSR